MTPSQQAALETLAGRTLTPGEVAMAGARMDSDLANSLSAGRTVVASVSRARFATWAAGTGVRGIIEQVSTTPADPLYSSALAILDFLHGAAEVLDLSDAQNQAMLAAWQTAGRITAQQSVALATLATVPVGVNLADVSAILNGVQA
jgi:hypothetical protein